jgi:PAS domain S-box-containing protein
VPTGRKAVSGLAGQATAVRAIRSSAVARYAIAVGTAILAIVLRLALDPVWGVRLPYITLFPGIMLSAWLGGFWPGVVTTLLCATAAEYFWIEPSGSWAVTDKTDLFGLLVFVAVGGVMSALNEAWRRSTADIAESEERLSVTLASIGDAVIATDEHGRVTRLNTVAEALTGCTAAEAVGLRLEEVFVIINEQTRRPAENPIGRVLREHVSVGLANHTVLISKDGREIPVDDSAAPITTADGAVTGAVMVFRDVSERRRVEQERTALVAAERLARADAEAAEHRLRVALEAGRMGTWQWTIGTEDLTWSPGLEAIHGYAPGTFPGTFETFRQEIHPEDRDRTVAAITDAVQQRHALDIAYRIVRGDGATRWVEERGQLFLNDRGEPDRLVGVRADVTERKQSEERFRLAIEAAPTAMIVVDRHGTITYANALSEPLFGYTPDELVGELIERLVPARFRGHHGEYRAGFSADATRRSMGAGRDLYALRKDGSEVPVEIGLSPFETADGAFAVAAVTDISARKQMESDLLERRRDAEHANRLKDEFLAPVQARLRLGV